MPKHFACPSCSSRCDRNHDGTCAPSGRGTVAFSGTGFDIRRLHDDRYRYHKCDKCSRAGDDPDYPPRSSDLSYDYIYACKGCPDRFCYGCCFK